MENYKLINNTAHSRYEYDIDGSHPFVEYVLVPPGEIHLTYTRVPRELEGEGIGSELLEDVMREIEREGWLLHPDCGFVQHFLRKRPEWIFLTQRR